MHLVPRVRRVALLLAVALLASACGRGDRAAPGDAASASGATARRIRLVTTTSVRDSGLLDALLPEFTKETALGVDVIAVGTGAAFRQGHDGNADLLLVHDRKGENEFVASGDGLERRDLMWNTFEVVGPPEDPAHVAGAKSGAEALGRIAKATAPFVSRGDDSGTHRRETALWKAASVPTPAWDGYVSTGQGMGPTLLVAEEKRAYTLTDRGTRLSFRAKLTLTPLVAEGADLRNEYAVVLLSPAKHPDLAHAEATRLASWLTSPATSRRIDAFKVGGEPLFHAAVDPR